MTRFQAFLLGFSSGLVAVVTAVLVYTTLALLSGWETLSGVVSNANAAQGALLGLVAGLGLGYLAGHWWPTKGKPTAARILTQARWGKTFDAPVYPVSEE